MKKYKVSRTFCIRMEWIVEAESEDAALAMLDDEDKTPSELGDEEYLGRHDGFDPSLLDDSVEEIVE